MKRWFPILIIIYILLAICWWGLLLYQKNELLYQCLYQNQGPQDILLKEYNKDRWMILGEGGVLGLTLLAGVWIIYRSAKQEIQSINNQKNFLLSVSHELKSPIAAIRLALETLKRPQLPEEKRNGLTNKALKDAQRLEGMVQNILLSSSIDNEDIKLYREIIDLSILIQNVINSIDANDRNKIKIEQPAQSVLIDGDRASLHHALINIISNALKYNNEPEILISTKRDKNKANIRIADNGIGIKDKDKERVFERFYRVNDNYNVTKTGTGLGLYLAKEIIEAHSGAIQLSDNLPQGTIVTITLPIK